MVEPFPDSVPPGNDGSMSYWLNEPAAPAGRRDHPQGLGNDRAIDTHPRCDSIHMDTANAPAHPGDQQQDQTGDRLQVRLTEPPTPTPPSSQPVSPPQMQAVDLPAQPDPRTVARIAAATGDHSAQFPQAPSVISPPPAPPVAAAPTKPHSDDRGRSGGVHRGEAPRAWRAGSRH